jgi:DNA invertase Pin-like site-specific DNA recombinase
MPDGTAPPAHQAVHAYIYDRRATPATGPVTIRLETCREYAAEQGWTIAGEWVDVGDDALSDYRRPRLDELLVAMEAIARTGRAVVLLVQCWDRLSRAGGPCGAMMRRVHTAGGWSETVDGEHDRRSAGWPVRAVG